jgi:diguanylate cyclase (GGDEF)-like protein/PAS domain S-box-containing protein
MEDAAGITRRTEDPELDPGSRLEGIQRILRLGDWIWTPASNRLRYDGCRWSMEIPKGGGEETLEGFLGLFHPSDRTTLANHLRRSLESRVPFEVEVRSRPDRGVSGIYQLRGGVFRDDPDGPLLFGVLQEITERWQTDRHFNLLQAALESLPIGITISDPEGRILYTNAAEAEIHGYAADELMAKKAAALFAPTEYQQPIPRKNLSLMGVFRRESVNIRKNGEKFPVFLTSVPVRSADGEPLGLVTACEDLTERKETEKRIERLAYYDLLTDLPNRTMFLSRLQEFLDKAATLDQQVAIIALDLDRFKDINDTLGHTFGDRLLKAVAQRLVNCMRKADIVARLGGDEFVVLQASPGGEDVPAAAAGRIIETISRSFNIDGRRVDIGVSIGIALFPTDGQDPETLMRHAELALYHAKGLGRSKYAFFFEDMNRRVKERARLEASLRRAIDDGQLMLFYQPQLDLLSGTITGVEALVRWRDDDDRPTLPLHSIAVAEDLGLIHPLGEWVLGEACRQGRIWTAETGRSLRIAVNISGQQFKKAGFLSLVDRVLAESGLPPECLELEMTENILMEEVEETIRLLLDLKARGVRLSIDDFGTGYSSLNYLKHFPLDLIKIDRSFLSEVKNFGDKVIIVEAITAMAHRMGLKVLAEGVETCQQLDFLLACGCNEGQGFLFAPPMPAEEMTELLQQGVFLLQDICPDLTQQ